MHDSTAVAVLLTGISLHHALDLVGIGVGERVADVVQRLQDRLGQAEVFEGRH